MLVSRIEDPERLVDDVYLRVEDLSAVSQVESPPRLAGLLTQGVVCGSGTRLVQGGGVWGLPSITPPYLSIL